MIAGAEFIFMRDGINDRIQTINVRADTNRLLLDAGVNFGNRFDGWIDRLRVSVNLLQEVSDGFNSELNPFAKIRIG